MLCLFGDSDHLMAVLQLHSQASKKCNAIYLQLEWILTRRSHFYFVCAFLVEFLKSQEGCRIVELVESH